MTSGTTGFPEKGDHLGTFRIGRRLGVGGMGVVYEALDTRLDRLVALKIIAPHLSHDDAFGVRFIREARAQASLDSPHVVQVYSAGEADGRLYIASQLIPDGDLGEMLREHGLPPTRVALHLLAQVADGLADAHAAGLVHRDIKAANVLLRHRDHALLAYLADFGIARQVGREDPEAGGGALTQDGAAVGTPAYMAPELHTGGEAGPLCDVYSLGCLLWTTLTGAAPYAGGTDYQVISGHVAGPVPQVEPTGPLAVEVNRVLSLALAKDPGRRHPSALALRKDLKRVLELGDDEQPLRALGTVVAVPAPPPTQPGRRFYAIGPPTPTPAPRPVSSAPPAPALTRDEASTPRPPPSARARRWVPLVTGGAVLAVAAIVLVVLLRGDGDDPAARDERAVEVLSVAFAAQAGVGDDDGRCIAARMVDDVGVDALIAAGVIDEDLKVSDEDLTDPEVLSELFAATFSCAGAGG